MSEAHSELQASLLAQALPFMQRYENKTIVVKYGGHAMGNAELGKAFASDVALLAVRRQSDRRAWRRPADRGDADEDGHRIEIRRGPARHRRKDGRDRRNGAGG